MRSARSIVESLVPSMNFEPEHEAAMKAAADCVRQDLQSPTEDKIRDALAQGPYLDDPALDFMHNQDDDVYSAALDRIVELSLTK